MIKIMTNSVILDVIQKYINGEIKEPIGFVYKPKKQVAKFLGLEKGQRLQLLELKIQNDGARHPIYEAIFIIIKK